MPTFDVYPQPQTALKTLDTALNKVWKQAIAERRSADTPFNFMYIRVAMAGTVPASPANYPTLQMQAGTGDPVTGPYDGSSPGSVYDQPGGIGGAGQNVGDAYFFGPAADGTYLIKILLYVPPGTNWSLIITNNDVGNRDFMFVVASDDGGVDGGARQPWISADTAVNFGEVLTSDSGNKNLSIKNQGTGDLTTITGVFSGTDAASFTFTPPANPIGPNTSDTALITLAPVASTKPLSAAVTVSSNDKTVTSTPGHNNVAALSGQVEQLELAFLVDASGSMALDPDGHDTNISGNISLTRYGILLTALEAAMNALAVHAANKGFFGLTIYPNITGFPATPSAPYGGPFPVPSPSAADFQSGKPLAITAGNTNSVLTALQQHFTRENGASTPMGTGIGAAIGDKLGTIPWGFFQHDDTSKNSNRRWLFLMTDGNQNDGPDPSDFYASTGSFAAKKIRVGAIGYGTETAITQPVNKALLTAIAQHGYLSDNLNYNFTEATGDPSDINMFIKPLMYQGLNFDTVTDPGGVLTSTNPVVTRQVPITAYDEQLSFFVSWTTVNAQRLRVQVRTPLGELLEDPGAGYTVNTNPRFRMLTFPKAFLANLRDPANPRFGVWTLILTLNPIIEIEARPAAAAVAVDSEKYNYDVFLSSRLKLQAQLNQKSYAAGDTIQISAPLTLDGTGIPNASVTLSRVLPGAGQANFLARSVLSAEEYNQEAKEQSANPDIDSTGIKLLGLAKKGLTFNPLSSSGVINMVDASNTGVYVASVSNTSVPGTYSFLITAVGALPDGSTYRRERALDIEVTVEPDPKSTLFHVDYSVITVGGRTLNQAVLTVTPQDRFPNAIFLDPRVDPSLAFTTTAGSFPNPIVDNHDGSYSRTLVYAPGDNPVVGVIVGGTVAVSKTPVVNLSGQHYIDRVFQFRPGREAVPGANKHTDPRACLGDFTTRPTLQFVSLGGRGSIVVGFKDQAMVGTGGGDDVTIFIARDEEPRPYLVEASDDDDCDDWYEIGRSPGVTQSFGLQHKGKVMRARALRISDLSERIRNNNGTPSPSPGPSIVAASALRLDKAHTDILEAIENVFKKIF